jgi:predicted transcriptional regulator
MAATKKIFLSDDLKIRIANAARRAGTSTHSFILEAIAEKVELEERRAGFDEEANARFASIIKSGRTIPWTDVRRYVEERLAGTSIFDRPSATKRE